MKKKILATALALCMVLSIFTATAAAEEPASADNSKISENSIEIIPVYGHIGSNADIISPDPDDPDPLPEAEIYVEVPIRILFAAFDADEGAITSPKYTITNLSETTNIKVEIENFTQQNDTAAPLENQLSLTLVSHENTNLLPELFPADYQSAKLVSANLSKVVEDSDSNILRFMIAGTWSGSFDKEIKPTFDMTVKFSEAA